MRATVGCSDTELEAFRAASATPPPNAVALTPAPIYVVAKTVDDTLPLDTRAPTPLPPSIAPVTPAPPTPAPPTPAPGSIGIGTIVAGKYRIDARIGDGATAVVWQARDLVLERDVALKTFAVANVHGDAARAVVQEAQATSDIGSDFIVPVHSACVDERLGVVAIDMKLCVERDANGQKYFARDLTHYICKDKPTRAQILDAARWVEEAAIGVQDAHASIVFHRDLKCANVVVSGVRRRASVLDFGLARAHGIAANKRGTMAFTTAQHDKLFHAGTPVNMAPEQARGLPRLDPANVEADRRTLVAIDVYGLGSILYELLAGRAPHDYEEDTTLWLTFLRAQKNEVDFDVLAKRKVPSRLLAILRRALASNPLERYPTAGALADALRAFRENRPFVEDKNRFHVRALLAMRRRRGLVASIVMSLGIFGTALGASAYELYDAEKATQAAHAEIARAQAALDDRQKQIAKLQEDIDELGDDQKRAEAEAADYAKRAESAATEKEREEARAKQAEALLRAKTAASKKEAEQHEQARLQAAAAHASEMMRLKGQQASEVAALNQNHAAALAQANKAHSDEVARLRAQQAQELQNLQAQHANALAQRDAAYQRALAERDAQYRATIQRKDAQIASLQRELAMRVKPAPPPPPYVRTAPPAPQVRVVPGPLIRR